MKKFTVSEVRDYLFSIEERSSRQWLIAHDTELGMLRQFVDLLEAQEKAVPVMVVNHVSSAEHDLPIGMKLYAHPVPSDAERLAEALRWIMRAAEDAKQPCGGDPESPAAIRNGALACISQAAAQSLGIVQGPSLTAHSAKAQPHDLIKTGDPDAAPSICDANGEVVLAYCRKCRQGEGDLAEFCPAQPPAARVTDALAVFEVVSGVEGPCLTISRKADGKPRHEYRLAGPKPWGGGNTTHSFKVHTRELREQIDAIEAALAAQESPNG